jgi:DNA-binding NarL/FixJ family response regulator
MVTPIETAAVRTGCVHHRRSNDDPTTPAALAVALVAALEQALRAAQRLLGALEPADDHRIDTARPTPGIPVGVLSHREVEVLRLLAAGLSNAEIADRLVIGHSTVKTHVTRLLTKLDLRDRAQAVVFAYETGFVQPGRTDAR